MRKTRKDRIYYGLRASDCCTVKQTYIYGTKSERRAAHKDLGNDYHYVDGTARDFLKSWRTNYEYEAIKTQLDSEFNAIK